MTGDVMTGHVLLIEDERNIVEAISFILSREGWRVDTHANGSDATDAIRRSKPDVIVLDVMLPGKSGHEILREIKADPDLSELPVLMLTARGQSRDREMAHEAGVSRFMTKPFANADVIDAIRTLAGH